MQLPRTVLAVTGRRSIEVLFSPGPCVLLVFALVRVHSRLGHRGVGDGGEPRVDQVVDLLLQIVDWWRGWRISSQSVEVYSECNALVVGLARHIGVGDVVGDGVEKPIDVPLLRLGLEV